MFKKKSLGQHFLNSKKIILDIVLAGKIKKKDVVLEIGPGEGTLTSALLLAGASVVAVEKDDRLIPLLQEKFSKEISSKQLTLIHDDILTSDIESIISNLDAIREASEACDQAVHMSTARGANVAGDKEVRQIWNYKVVANIPYYITGQIIRMFLESDKQPQSMTLLIQKEVAERIVAKDGKESLLSLSIKIYGEPKLVRTVGRGAFSPQPNVDSAVLVIENISRKKLVAVKPPQEEKFFKILHAGFAHKRKQLLPNLSSLFKKNDLIKIFNKYNIDLKSRAEDLPLETWLKLCNTIAS